MASQAGTEVVEKKVQNEIINFLRNKKKCFVIKTKPGFGTPTATPDILFWGKVAGVIECKAYRNSPYRPGQEYRLKWFADRGYYSRTAYTENKESIIAELNEIL